MRPKQFISPLASIFFFAFAVAIQAQNFSFLTNGLVASYSFYQNANDGSGNGYNGIVTQAVLAVDRFNVSNSAYNFSGNGWINLTNKILNGANSQGTVSLWFLANKNSVTNQYLLAAHGVSGGQPNRIYLVLSGGKVVATIGNPSKDILSPTIQTQEWYHSSLVWTNGGNKATLYLNGQEMGTANAIGLSSNISAINLGCWNKQAEFLHGKIDDVRFYNRALSSNEIQQLYDFESAQLKIDKAIELSWNAYSNQVFQIQSSSNLTNWTDYGNPLIGQGGFTNRFFRTDETNRFFRLKP